jgi:hypothetical protein
MIKKELIVWNVQLNSIFKAMDRKRRAQNTTQELNRFISAINAS